MNPRWRLFTKYAALIIALVSAALLASGLTSLYFSYGENQDHLITLQREKAIAAATASNSTSTTSSTSSAGPRSRR